MLFSSRPHIAPWAKKCERVEGRRERIKKTPLNIPRKSIHGRQSSAHVHPGAMSPGPLTWDPLNMRCLDLPGLRVSHPCSKWQLFAASDNECRPVHHNFSRSESWFGVLPGFLTLLTTRLQKPGRNREYYGSIQYKRGSFGITLHVSLNEPEGYIAPASGVVLDAV